MKCDRNKWWSKCRFHQHGECVREYWIICREPGFPAVTWFGSSPTPSSVSWLSLFLRLAVCRQSSLLSKEGDGGGWARSRIKRPRESLVLYNHSILSGVRFFVSSLPVSPVVSVFSCDISFLSKSTLRENRDWAMEELDEWRWIDVFYECDRMNVCIKN